MRAARPFAAHRRPVERAARTALGALEVGPCELSVALVDDAAMQRLNRDWRAQDRPTDVLAFAQREGDDVLEPGLLGDVVIAVPTAERQARQRDATLAAELEELLVHGILHLLGYDHERSAAEARRMFARSRQVLATLRGGPGEPRGRLRKGAPGR